MRRRNIGWGAAAVCAVVLAGCVGAAADHEVIADEAYAEGRYADAMTEYRLALVGNESNTRLHRKAGVAAMRAGDLVAAAQEFERMAAGAGDRDLDLASEGLVRVARMAVERGEQAALLAALEALEAISPESVLRGLSPEAVATLGGLPEGHEGRSVLLHAAAGAPDARAQDSLMLVFAQMEQRSGRCEDALVVYESLVRRERAPGIAREARGALVACALQQGRAALDGGEPSSAESWFELAASRAASLPAGRVAYLGLGDVRFALGDVLGAIEAYEQARAGLAPGDSIYALVAERLHFIATPPAAVP